MSSIAICRWIFDVDEKVSDTVPISWTTDRDRKKRLADEVYNDLRKHHRDLTKCFQEKVDLLVEDASIRNAEQAIMIEVRESSCFPLKKLPSNVKRVCKISSIINTPGCQKDIFGRFGNRESHTQG